MMGYVVVAMVTDVPLSGLFNGERTAKHNDTSPAAERRLKDNKEEYEGLARREKKSLSLVETFL